MNARVWDLLFLKNLKGIGKRFINDFYVPTFSESDDVRYWIRHAIPLMEEDLDEAEAAADRIVSWLETHPDVQAVTCFDQAYPARLGELGADRPPLLYVRAGRPNWLEEAGSLCCAAVIGSRWPGEWIWEHGPGLVEGLCDPAAGDLLVVSGLARGCDGIGHRGAMTAGAGTVAVMASGIDIVTPAMHAGLAEEIVGAGGAILSEYDPGMEAGEYQYAERDRLVAALSDGLLVLECAENSGTMLTVRAGAKLGRRLGCILPEDLDASAAKTFAGNIYMKNEMAAETLSDGRSVAIWRDQLLQEFRQSRAVRRTGREMTVQMSFL